MRLRKPISNWLFSQIFHTVSSYINKHLPQNEFTLPVRRIKQIKNVPENIFASMMLLTRKFECLFAVLFRKNGVFLHAWVHPGLDENQSDVILCTYFF